MMTRRQFIERMLALGLTSTSIAALLETSACAPQSAAPQSAAPQSAAPQLTVPPATTPVPPVALPTEGGKVVLPTATAGAKAAATLAVAPTVGAATTVAPGSTYLAVARGDDPAQLVRRAIKALGGMERFVKSGQSVIVKPNICVAYHPPEYAVTTNPQVVAELVKLCREAGASSVTVMDHPFGGTAEQAYKISQIGCGQGGRRANDGDELDQVQRDQHSAR